MHPDVKLSPQELQLFAKIADDECGIHIPDHKLELIQNRLQRRLKALHLPDYMAYHHYLTNNYKRELQEFVDAITTNETYFFRGPKHFYLLSKQILPTINSKEIKIWSAASSTGEEAYSIAILMRERLQDFHSKKVSIYASDINLTVLKKAHEGLYDEYTLRNVKPDHLSRYFSLRSNGRYQIKNELRQMVKLGQHNFMKPFPHGQLDIIFCRNALIYFEQDNKKIVIDNLISCLKPGGYLFLGESEIIPQHAKLRRIDASVGQKA